MGELLSLAGVSNPPKRSFPLPLWSLGCLAMLLLLCVVGTGFAVISFVQSAQRFNQDRVNVTAVLDQFMQAGQQQNAHTGYNLFAVGTPQTSVTMTYLEDLFANHREFFAGYKMVQPGTLQTSSDLGSSSVNAFMAGDVVYVNHANVPYTAYFLQANGQWKLLRVQFGQVVGALLTATAVATVAPSKTPFLGDSTVTALAALSLVTPEDYFNRGRQYAGKGDYQDALTDYDVALHLQPDYADALYNRGYIYALQNDTDKALDDFSNAIRLQPTNEVFYNGRGIVYTNKHEYPHALADLTQSIQLKPDFVAAYLNRGNVYRDLKDYDAAIKDYDRCIQLDSQFTKPYLLRGIAYVDKGNYSQARLDWEMVLQMKGDPADQEVARRNLQQLPPTPTP